MMRSLQSQRGLAAATIVIVLILAAVTLVIGRRYFQADVFLDQRAVTEANLKRISDSLVVFASLNRRLPCPAHGESANGTEVTSGPSTCTYEDGVVPWVTLGLRRVDAADSWGGKISYRVYADATDGFTRAGGVDATNCSMEVAVGVVAQAVADCDSSASHVDHPVHFLRAVSDPTRKRGLVVNDMGALREGLAFVLISHGSSGRGAFGVESGTRAESPASAGEIRNTLAPSSPPWNSPFVLNSQSAAFVAPDKPDHFDDMVAYLAAEGLVAKARLTARSWPSSPAVFDAPTLSLIIPGFDSSQQDTGVSTLNYGRVRITASAGGVGQNIGFNERDGTGGIGVAGGSSGGRIGSDNFEVLTLDAGAGSTFQKVDVAFNEFQTRTFAPFAKERVEVTLRREGDVVQTLTVESWQSQGEDYPSLCLLESIPGTTFDRMDIRPLVRLLDGGISRFTLASAKACSVVASSCTTTVGDPGAIRCPDRPPSATSTAAEAIAATTATLKGIAQDNGAATAVSFDYGTTCSYPSNAAATPANLAAGAGKTTITAAVAGLTCNTSYYFRTKAVSAGGTTTGSDAMFTTAACASPMPIATTGAATAITQTTATLNGTASDNGANTTVTFDYGPTSCYGSGIAATPGVINSGTGASPVSASLAGLSCNTRYHYRVRAVSAAGTTTASDAAFTTAPCP